MSSKMEQRVEDSFVTVSIFKWQPTGAVLRNTLYGSLMIVEPGGGSALLYV